MPRINIKQIGIPIKTIITNQKRKDNQLIADIMKLGKKTHQFMLDFIAKKTKTSVENMRNSTSLIEAITFNYYNSATGFGWAIGDINVLKSDSPHWYWVNYGGKHPLADKQYPKNFVPGYFSGAGVFIYAPYNKTGIIVSTQKIFEPMGYIEATRAFLDSEIQKVLNRYNR